jgi:uncharacterized protein
MLNNEQRKTLLQIARDAIVSALDGATIRLNESAIDAELSRPSGAFVTLSTRGGHLRGCIGSIHPVAPLYRAVHQSALNAAFRDPRFRPIRREELPDISLEISVMGPIEVVKDVEEIMVGRDGLIISCGLLAGLLLPQVATEYRWDRDTFLSQTCIKAGLPPAAWQSADTKINRFAAEVFGE